GDRETESQRQRGDEPAGRDAEAGDDAEDAVDRRIAVVEGARQRPVEERDREKDRSGAGDAEQRERPQRRRRPAELSPEPAKPVADHDPAIKQPARRRDEESRGDHIREKVTALRDPDDADAGAEGERAADRAPPPRRCEEKGGRDEIESDRRIASRKR